MTDSLPDPIRAFVETTNAGDSDAFVAIFTEDARLEDWGRVFTGPEGVRSWDGTDNIGKQSHFDVVSSEPGTEPETYVVTLKVTGNGYNGTGPMTFRLHEGRIAGLTIAP